MFDFFRVSSLLVLAILANAWAGPGHDHGDGAPVAVSSDSPKRQPDGSVFLPKIAQRQLQVRTETVAVADLPQTVELAGRVVADPNAGGKVQPTQAGRIEPGPRGLPSLGQAVRKGEVLAYVRASESATPELKVNLELAKKKLARLEQLEGAVPQREIETARIEVQSLSERLSPSGGAYVAREALMAPVSGVIAAAHAAGLQVTAHVETAADFRHAVRAGVDELAHVPGWLVSGADDAERATLTEGDGQLAAARRVRVVTTSVAGRAMPSIGGHHGHGHHEGPASKPNEHRTSSADEPGEQVLKDNLSLLHRAGVPLVIGSDHADTSLAEVLHLHSLGLFDNLTLLKMWCEATPAAIFPTRKIGRFAEGYEASFLALAGNPIEDFSQVQAIRRRFKQGVFLGDSVGSGAASSAAIHEGH